MGASSSSAPVSSAIAEASSSSAGGGSEESKSKPSDAPAELIAVVDDLLDSLSKKFATVSTEIFDRMDAINKRLDAMEQMLNSNSATQN